MDVLDRVRAFLDYLGGQENKGGVYANASGSASPPILFRKQNGLWRWVGVPTNNYQDVQKQTITADAHRRYVRAIESGLFKRLIGQDAPELWLWHLPVPIATAEMVAWDERGFVVAGGTQLPGDFYSAVFEGLANWSQEHPGELGMSHATRAPFATFDEEEQAWTEYMSHEFTLLPLTEAANRLTAAGVVISKEYGAMKMRDDQQAWFADVLGDHLQDFDQMLAQMEEAGADLPRKELSMSEEQAVEPAVEKEVEAEVEVIEEVTETVDEVEEVAEVEEEVAEVAKEDTADDDGVAEEPAATEAPEPQYVTMEQLTHILEQTVGEITKGLTEGITEALSPVLAKQQEMEAEVAAYKKELETANTDAFERAADAVQYTPMASLAARVKQSVVDSQQAIVKENESLGAPEETKDDRQGVVTGISSIDNIIKAQRAQRNVVAGR